jgi:IgA-specific serine endopeptidase
MKVGFRKSTFPHNLSLLTRNLVMQNLSQRLEKDISEMMISNGDTKKARKRKHQRRPLEKARRKVLKEQLLQEEFEDEQDVRAETRRAQDEAAALRSMRLSRPPYARTDIGETLGSEDEDYIVLRPYPAPPDQMEPESEQHRVERELREKSKSEQHAVRDEQKKVAFERELLRKQRQAFDVERNQFEEERRRQHQDDKIRRERSEREREHEVRRRRSEEPRREREQDERVRSEQDEDSRVARVYEEPRHRRRRGGRMSFF